MIPWTDFLDRFQWRQGEHVTLVGPTGAGKTTLATSILNRRKWVLVLAAKPRDPLISDLESDGYIVRRDWPIPRLGSRFVYWPDIDSPEKVTAQREGFRQALIDVYRQGAWCVYLDELRYVTDTLQLGPLVELLWQHGRSLGVSLVGGTQRPAHIPLSAYSQATHLFFWHSNDAADLKRLRELGGRVDPKALQAAILALRGHEVLYVNTRTGETCQTVVEAV